MGKLSIKGIQVEVFGGVQKRLEDGAWEPPVDVAANTVTVNVQGMAIPVLSSNTNTKPTSSWARREGCPDPPWLDSHVTP
jgi:hypothetical protein